MKVHTNNYGVHYMSQLLLNMRSSLEWLIHLVSLHWRKLTFLLPAAADGSSTLLQLLTFALVATFLLIQYLLFFWQLGEAFFQSTMLPLVLVFYFLLLSYKGGSHGTNLYSHIVPSSFVNVFAAVCDYSVCRAFFSEINIYPTKWMRS